MGLVQNWGCQCVPDIFGFCRKIRARGCLVYARRRRTSEGRQVAIEFKGSHFERDVILWGVRWYVAYPISYRQLEEMMEDRGVEVDHSALNRWVLKHARYLSRNFERASVKWVAAGEWTRPI
jgi:hypothetical protein